VARVGGRNSFMTWVVGVGCAAVIGVLLVLAVPAIPAAVSLVGDTLRGAGTVPSFAQGGTVHTGETNAPECRALYTDALWSQLTQRAGGDPVQDTAPPATSATTLAAALAPSVRVTCGFTGVNAGRIVTTVSDVASDAASVARATLEVSGFACNDYADGVRCTRDDAGVLEEDVVRGGVWITTTFEGWRPDRYVERMAQQLWPEE
jgi:hypothetical protein